MINNPNSPQQKQDKENFPPTAKKEDKSQQQGNREGSSNPRKQ